MRYAADVRYGADFVLRQTPDGDSIPATGGSVHARAPRDCVEPRTGPVACARRPSGAPRPAFSRTWQPFRAFLAPFAQYVYSKLARAFQWSWPVWRGNPVGCALGRLLAVFPPLFGPKMDYFSMKYGCSSASVFYRGSVSCFKHFNIGSTPVAI